MSRRVAVQRRRRRGAEGRRRRTAEIVAAIGELAPARAQRFALPGSLARDVLRTRDVVAVENFSDSERPLQRVAPTLRIGPMLLAPLIAHDKILGVLAVTRDQGAPPFDAARHPSDPRDLGLRRARAVESRAARAIAGRGSREEPLSRDGVARAAHAADRARRLR